MLLTAGLVSSDGSRSPDASNQNGGSDENDPSYCLNFTSRCSRVSDLPAGFRVCEPVLLQSSLEFPFSQAQTELQHLAGQGRVSPCGAGRSHTQNQNKPGSERSGALILQETQSKQAACVSAISWCNVTERPLDVTANGYKHGVTKKALGTPKAR